PGEEGFLSISVDPRNISGTGKATMYLFDITDPSVKDTITFIISAGVNGIHTYAASHALKIYPNPASETVHVKVEHSASFTNASIHILDVVGKTVYDVSANANDWTTIAVNSLSPGIYFVRYDNGNGLYSTKKLEIIK